LAHRPSLPPDRTNAPPAPWTLPEALTRPLSRVLGRIFPGALGAFGGVLVGFLMSSYTCSDGIANCYPTEELKVGLVAVAGLLVGLLASRLRRSMTSKQKTLMTAATPILLVVFVVACFNRINPWSCRDSSLCEVPGGPFPHST
jgi:hypothetical protein